MVYLLSEINGPRCINESIISYIISAETPSLMLCKLNKLEFYFIHSVTRVPCLELVESLTINDTVIAITSFRPTGLSKDWLIVLTESNGLFVLGYHEDKFVQTESITFDASGQQQTIDSNAEILVDPSKEPSYIIVHNYQAVIQLFILNQDVSFENLLSNPKNSKRKLDNNELWEVKTLPIGNIVVQKMVMLENTDNVLAILYRDFKFNYSLRYYQIDTRSKNITLVKQFEEFDEPPTNLIATKEGGVLVLTALHIFYFPNPNVKYLELSNKSRDSSLSVNTNEIVITKTITNANVPEFLDQIFSSHVVIDQTRILVISNTGLSFIIYFDARSYARDSFTVNSLNFIRLGMTTIPSNVHHINNNLFFVSSKLSQSLLFEILPGDPYINIIQFVPSSPPILDVDIKYNEYQLSLLACQSGYNSGEFKKYSRDYYELSLLKHIQTENAASLSIFKYPLTVEIYKTDNTVQILELRFEGSDISVEESAFDKNRSDIINSQVTQHHNIKMTKSNVKMNDKIIDEEMNDSLILPNSPFMYVNKNKEIVIYNDSAIIQRYKVSTASEISDFDFLHIFYDEYLIFISFWDGTYELHLVSPDKYKVICQESLSSSSAIVSVLMAYNMHDQPDSVWIFLSTTNGDLIQFNYNFRKETKARLSNASFHLNDLPLKLMKNDHNDILLFNKNRVLALKYDPTICFYKSTEILNKRNINDVKFLDNNHIAILSDSSNVELFEFEEKKEIDSTMNTIYSNVLNKKSINFPGTNYSVLISFENKPNPVTEELQNYSYLKLIDNRSMELLHVFEFPDESAMNLIDLSFIPNDSDSNIPKNSFIVISDSPNKNELILLFKIRKNKIIKLPKIDIIGLLDCSSITLSSITPLDLEDLTYFISGNLNFIVRLEIADHTLRWRLYSESISQLPILTLCTAIKNDYIVMGDVMKGLFNATLCEDTEKDELKVSVSKIDTAYEPNFLTSLDLISYEEDKAELIYGDSLGNLASMILSKNSEEAVQPLAFNVGDQINVVKSFSSKSRTSDFNSVYDNQLGTRLTEPIAIIGTVHGAIYELSRLVHDEDVEDILSKCQHELVLHSQNLDTLGKPKKDIKCSDWSSEKDWKSLRKDGTGSFIRKEHFGVIDLRLFKKWLTNHYYLSKYDQRGDSNERSLLQMKKELKTCYKNKTLLQRLVYEIDI